MTRIPTNVIPHGDQRLLPPHPAHLVSVLRVAATTSHATQVHAQSVLRGLTSLPLLHTTLVTAYARCGAADSALLLASSPTSPPSPATKVVAFTSILTQFARAHQPLKALALFSHVRRRGLCPNHFTFSTVLRACAHTGAPANGEQVHALAVKSGLDANVFVASAMVDMYAKCGDATLASKVFSTMPQRNLVTWNALIVGFVSNKKYNEAMAFFREMLMEEHVHPDEVSFSSVFCACANTGGLDFGRQVHSCVVKLGMDSRAYVNNSLIDMYSRCGCFVEALELFGCVDKDVVTWNVISMGWVQNGMFEEVFNCFWAMRREGIYPDEAAFSTALHASAGLTTLGQGASIHDQIVKTGFTKNPCLGNSLITMYAKCGELEGSHRIFQEMDGYRNAVSWTAIIDAYQQHGRGSQAIELFENMLAECLEPDYITYVCVLSACSHSGLLDKGFEYFHLMYEVHGIRPGYEHFACMVDMLGRAGQLAEARAYIGEMPLKPDASIWGALLGACRKYGNLEMGKEAAHNLFEMEPYNSGNYTLLCNMYLQHGKLEEAEEVRRLMGLHRVRKETGVSWIDVKNRTYVFKVHDQSHQKMDKIYDMLEIWEDLIKNKGYVTEIQADYKEHNSWYHSERLALAFGLISLPADAPIRIKKNLRTCGDCHEVIKLSSEIFKREIIVRDTNRFHQFTNGSCSCGDYW